METLPTIKLPLNSNGDLPSQLTNALTGQRIDLQGGRAHLYTALAVRWRSVSRSAHELVSQLRQLQAKYSDCEDFHPAPTLEALRALIYDANEAFDLYQKDVSEQLKKGRNKSELQNIKYYKDSITRLRDPISIMCNRMKHNFLEILPCRIVSQATGKAGFVYRLNAAYEGVQMADKEVHSEGGFISIERTLHQIVHGLLRADHSAGVLVQKLSPNSEIIIDLRSLSDLGLSEVLADLASHVPIIAESEYGCFDGIKIDNNSALLTRVVGEKIEEPTTRTMLAVPDAAALSIELMF